LTASGGTSPYTYSTSSSLPNGVTLSSGGLLSGTPTQSGTYNLTIQVTDNASRSTNVQRTLSVGSVNIGISPLSSNVLTGTQNSAFSQQFTASGGTAPYTYSAIGQLPPGLSLTNGGLLAGTPTSSGTFGFTISALDANSNSGTATYSLVVGAVTITGPDTVLVSAAAGGGSGVIRYVTDVNPYFYVDVIGDYTNSRTPGNVNITWQLSGDLVLSRYDSMVTIDPTGYGSPAREDPMPLAMSGTAVMKPLNYYQSIVRLIFYLDNTQPQTQAIEEATISVTVGTFTGPSTVTIRNT
jgi:hypothetical protein